MKDPNFEKNFAIISHKITSDIPEMPSLDYSSVKQKSPYHRAKLVTLITSIVLILTLSGCYVARQIYFGNMVYFKNMENDEYVTVVNETQTVDGKSITLQAVMTDGLKTYARFKYEGDVNDLQNDMSYVITNSVTSNHYTDVDKLCVSKPHPTAFHDKIASAGIIDRETGKISIANDLCQLENKNVATVTPTQDQEMTRGLEETEAILTFDTAIKDNQKFDLQLIVFDSYLNSLDSNITFTFKDLTVKCPDVTTKKLNNISIQTKYDTVVLEKITSTILHTYIDFRCIPNEKYKASDTPDIDYTDEYYKNSERYFLRISCKNESEDVLFSGDYNSTIRFNRLQENSEFSVDLYEGIYDKEYGYYDFDNSRFVKHLTSFKK